MRIIAGKYRRRKLQTNPGLTTRPITDRVKVILFDRLPGVFEDARVADIFAGTGTMGLEALSRGAASVVFMERDHQAHSLLMENVRYLKAESQALCWRTDAVRSSFLPKGVPDFLPYEVIFFDPPYRMAEEIRPGVPIYEALERLAREQVSSPGAQLIFRCGHGTQMQFPPTWELENQFRVTSMDLYVFRRGTPVSQPEAEAVQPS